MDAAIEHVWKAFAERLPSRPRRRRALLTVHAAKRLDLRHVLVVRDFWRDLSFAGRRPPDSPIHRRLAALRPGSSLRPRCVKEGVWLVDEVGGVVPALSREAARGWAEGLPGVESMRCRRSSSDLQTFRASGITVVMVYDEVSLDRPVWLIRRSLQEMR